MPVLVRMIRNVPGCELKEYFDRFPMTFPDPINWDGEGSEIIAPVLKAVDALTDVERERIRVDADRIDRMTTEVGQTALLAVATPAQRDHLQSVGIRHARSLWLFRTDPFRFRQAEDVAYFENARRGRTWDAFVAPKGRDVARDEDRKGALAAEVRRFFREGEKVKIDVFDRSRPDAQGVLHSLVQVIAYREGLPDSVDVFKSQYDIGPLIYRPVYELGFTYEAETGVIEVVGDRRIGRQELARIFARTLLDHTIDGNRIPLRYYDLSVFLTERDFPTDIVDNIGDVRVRLVKLENFAGSGFFTIEARTPEETVYSLAGTFEEHNPLRGGGYRIREVVLAVPFLPDPVNPRGRTILIKLRHPSGCDLKDKTDKERLIGDKYLKRWGILQDLDDAGTT